MGLDEYTSFNSTSWLTQTQTQTHNHTQNQTQKPIIKPHIIQSQFSHTFGFNIMVQEDLH